MNLQGTSTEYNKIVLDAFYPLAVSSAKLFFLFSLFLYNFIFEMAKRKPKLSLLQVVKQEGFL